MERLHFSVSINAPATDVWPALLEDETYRMWTAAFAEGSHAVTDWKEGSDVLFLDGKGQGMVSKVVKHVPNQLLEIEHLGVVKDGNHDTDSEEVKAWAGALETYAVKESDGVSVLDVEVDVDEKERGYFDETFPKALAKLKELAESRS